MFDRVTAALNAANLTDKYLSKFIEQEITDDVILECLPNREDLIFLNDLIPITGQRVKFLSEFRKTGTLQSQPQPTQQKQRSSSPEIEILHEKVSSTSSSTTTTHTQIKIEPSSSSSTFTSFSFQNSTTTDFTTLIKNSYDGAVQLYTRNMNDLFSVPDFFLDESALAEKHQENRSKVIENFSSAYKEYKNNLSQVTVKSEEGEILTQPVKMEKENEENFNVKMSDLHDEIKMKFGEYQEKNDLRKYKYISKANSFVREAEKLYMEQMTKFLESCTDEDELKEKEREVNEQVVKCLNNNIQNPQATSVFIQKLNEDLKQSVNQWFGDHLELFQLRREEDEIDLRESLLTVKSFYNEEMEKELNSGNFIEPAQLVEINRKISDATLKLCEEKNPDLKYTENQEQKLKEAMKVIYKKYEDRNLLRKPTSSYAIGIDLGTTNSCVAVYRNGKVEVIHNENGNKTTPSFVCFQDDDSVLVGDFAKDQSYRNPENTIFDSKRLIGRNFDDEKVQQNIKTWSFDVVNENNKPKIRVKKSENSDPPTKKRRQTSNSNKIEAISFKTYHPEQISALVLKKMKKIAEDYLGVEVKDAVITVPALFNDYQRQSTKDAGEIAGLNVLRIINEPTAAAIAYNLHRKDDLKRNVLVFDLGGGTLDVVVLQILKGEINVKSVHGDTHLGGNDFDTEMMKYCIDSFKNQHGIDLARHQNSNISTKRFEVSSRLRRIRNECERQKKVLSSATKTTIGINAIESDPKLLDLHVPFTRELLESLNQKNFDRCIEIIQLALNEAKMSKSDIKDIVLVGGSSRIPKLQKMISDFFDGKTLSKSINPDEAVAEGASIQACILSGQKVNGAVGMKLNDVTPFPIGISATINDIRNRFSIIVPKNTVVPCEKTQFYNSSVGSRSVGLPIHEGEDPVASKNNLLGEFILENVPIRTEKEEEKNNIKVTMKISTEGILHVRADCTTNGVSNEIVIKIVNHRITRQEIEDAKASVNLLMK